jgi:acyl dehydratase
VAIKEGWSGRVFEDFEVGDVYEHALGRTVLAVDNSWFTLLTQNTNPIHFDAAYAARCRVLRGSRVPEFVGVPRVLVSRVPVPKVQVMRNQNLSKTDH